jgi:hypothetical protein
MASGLSRSLIRTNGIESNDKKGTEAGITPEQVLL